MASSSGAKQWYPPTPESIFTPIPGPSLQHSDSFELLPPPLEQFDVASSAKQNVAVRPSEESGDSYRATPSNLAGLLNNNAPAAPLHGYFADDNASSSSRRVVELKGPLLPLLPAPAPSKSRLNSPPLSKRPRREAATTARIALRQPSPLDLSPPLRPTGSQSNRKVSHSLIERRRREKINDCLAALRSLVPHCREEGERKEARAKERGRKRGRRDEGEDEGSRGGLHKLEILQGTLLYIQELEARLAAVSTPDTTVDTPSREATSSPELALQQSAPQSSRNLIADAPILPALPALPPLPLPGSSMGRDEEEACLLLLKFSTSPELRPVVF